MSEEDQRDQSQPQLDPNTEKIAHQIPDVIAATVARIREMGLPEDEQQRRIDRVLRLYDKTTEILELERAVHGLPADEQRRAELPSLNKAFRFLARPVRRKTDGTPPSQSDPQPKE